MIRPDRSRIVFDATPLEVRNPSGVSRYTRELLRALKATPLAPRLLLASTRPLDPMLHIGTAGRLPVGFPNRWLWMQALLPPALALAQPVLCHFTNYLAPLYCPVPYVLTVHDLSLAKFPQAQTLRSRLLVTTLLPFVARRARAVLTLSEVSRRDVVAHLNVPASRVHVIGGAPIDVTRASSGGEDPARILQRLGIVAPYILAVGTLEPRKNLLRLVQAFVALRQAGRPERLVLVGQPGWKYGPLLALLESAQLRDSVTVTGYLGSDDLAVVYAGASVLAYPSLYEGLGLPSLEALTLGTPVVTSKGSAMEEMAGDAAIYAEPTSVESIARALQSVLTDPDLRQRLRQAGPVRAGHYTWAAVANRTVRVYEDVIADASQS